MYVILTYLIDNLMFDQWLSFVLSSLAILVQTGIAFRSAWLGVDFAGAERVFRI